MANDQFARIMRFAQRTGDRLIVTDPEGKEPVVVMPLDAYEMLVDGVLGPVFPDLNIEDNSLLEEEMENIELPESPAVTPILEVERTDSFPTTADASITAATAKTSEISSKTLLAAPDEDQFYLESI